MKQVLENLHYYLKNGDTVIVGCSGGPDSMCLLSLLLNSKMSLNIICAHVNHQVRPESEEEYKYVEGFCNKHNIIFQGIRIIVSEDNFEKNARDKRCAFFEKLRQKYHAKYIMTAHHGDDLVETILMRITRGSNLSGYAGIKILDGYYLRIMLPISKDDVIKYVKENNIKYYWDESNDANVHTRNRYRHNILPELKKENPKVHEKYLHFSQELNDYNDYLNEVISQKKIVDGTSIDLEKFKKERTFLQRKILERLIKNIQKKAIFEVNNNLITQLLQFINSKKNSSKLNLSNGFVAIKSYNEFKILQNLQMPILNKVEFHDKYENNEYVINKIIHSDAKSNWVLRLNSEEITLPLYIRCRHLGDTMEVKNLGHKKIKDILIDLKVPLDKRDQMPILIDSKNTILWLPGYKKSKFDKEKNEKYDIILLCERKK